MNSFVDRASQIVLGEGSDEKTDMGPLVSKEQQERVERFIEIGSKEAALATYASAASSNLAHSWK